MIRTESRCSNTKSLRRKANELPDKESLSTPAPPRVQPAMTIQPLTHSRSLALGRV
jgi:hypothetical protein